MSVTKTKTGFSVIQMVEIPIRNLRVGVIKAMQGRQMYVDTDNDINEQIFAGNVFSTMLEEDEGLSQNSLLTDLDDLIQVQKLADEMTQYELIRVNKI
jgi:hypothetical protein